MLSGQYLAQQAAQASQHAADNGEPDERTEIEVLRSIDTRLDTLVSMLMGMASVFGGGRQ